MSEVTWHILPTPTATVTDPLPGNYPTMHSRLVRQKHKPKLILKPKNLYYIK